MSDRSFLLVSHDAGATVPPMMALAEAMVRRGHEVTWMGQRSIGEQAVGVGCRFVAFESVPDYEAGRAIEEQPQIAFPMLTGPDVGEEVINAATSHGSGAIVVDANLAGAAAAAEASKNRSAILLHSMYKTFVDTWFAQLWPLMAPAINTTREGFGLPPCQSWPGLFAGHDRVISVVPRRFDAPVAQVPDALRHFGFLVPVTGLGHRDVLVPGDDRPMVLIALSTTYQRQEALMQEILDAVGGLGVRAIGATAGQVEASALRCPANVELHDFVDHGVALERADVVITHAGLGTVAAALHRGVPLVCTPIGQDQHLKAERVESVEAGITVVEPRAAQIGRAVEAVLTRPVYTEAARAISMESVAGGGAESAVQDLETLQQATSDAEVTDPVW